MKTKRFRKGQEIYWRTMFGDYFRGIIIRIERKVLIVDRLAPAGAYGVIVEKKEII